jgi:POT family proton-dependent oligopeptide transporter
MDKNLGFGLTVLPAQIQVVNGLLILAMVPLFTFGIYPLMGKFFEVTPLRKMGMGLFLVSVSFVIVGRIEGRIQDGVTVSAWWQILAYVVLSAAEVLVSITALEFSYKQAPLRMKSFIMALSNSVGNMLTATVTHAMIRPLHATQIDVGKDTWVHLDTLEGFVTGQKIDVGGELGVQARVQGTTEWAAMSGTYLVAAIDKAQSRVKLVDVVDRKPIESNGRFTAEKAELSTYKLVGPEYFDFFAAMMACMAVVFVLVAVRYKEKTHVRQDAAPAAA